MPKNLAPIIAFLSACCLVGHTAAADQDKRDPKPPVDQQGDPLPAGAVARLGTTRWRLHESPLTFSPNGRYAIVAGETTRLIDPATGTILSVFPVRSYAASFSGDNKTVMLGQVEVREKPAPGTKYSVVYLDVETGKIKREIEINGTGWRWSADGKRVVCRHQIRGGNWNYCVWDLERGVELYRWEKPPGDFALSADGSLLAVRSVQEISVFSIADKKPVCQWSSQEPSTGRTAGARVVRFLPDGKTLIAAESRRVLMWDAMTGQLKPKGKLSPVLETAREEAVTLATSADGRYLAAGGSKGMLYLWDLQDDVLLHTLPDAGHGLPIYNLNFTPDGKRLVSQAHLFPSARVWDVASGKELSPTAAAASHITAMVFSPDGRALATTGAQDPTRDPVLLWDAASGKLLHRLERDATFAFHPDGKTLVTSSRDEAALWNFSDGTLRQRVKAAYPQDRPPGDITPWIATTPCCPDDDTIVAMFAGDVRKVLPATRGGKAQAIPWTMAGLADAKTGKVRRSFRVECDHPLHPRVSPDGRWLAAVGSLCDRTDNSASVLVWDLRRGVELFHADLPGSHGWEHLAFSADSRSVFLTSCVSFGDRREHEFRIIEVASGKARTSFMQELEPRTNPSRGGIASDRLAVVTKGATVSLFDPLTGHEFGRLQTSQDRIGCLAFSPDGKRLACAGDDTTALIWDVADLVPAQTKSRLDDADLERLWAELLNPDAATAFRALRRLAQAPDQTVDYLGKQMQPVPLIPEEKIKALVAKLDSDSFAEREQAGRELLQLPDLAEPALVKAGENPSSLEARRRIEVLLDKLQEMKAKGPWTLSDQLLRDWRAVEVLERIGTPEAVRLLERLARGAPYAAMTRQAHAAVQRITKRTGQP